MTNDWDIWPHWSTRVKPGHLCPINVKKKVSQGPNFPTSATTLGVQVHLLISWHEYVQ
jgi:hypothetical protein